MGRVVTDLCFFKKKGNNNFEGKHLQAITAVSKSICE